jgi:hypothetical protein
MKRVVRKDVRGEPGAGRARAHPYVQSSDRRGG